MPHASAVQTNPTSNLRQEFDETFTRAPLTDHAKIERLLAIRIGDDAYALRLDEISGLSAGRHVVPLPTPIPALRGVAGFRGQIVPVYDLGVLLGYALADAPRWMVLVRREETVALAFTSFEAQMRVGQEDLATMDETSFDGLARRPHLGGAVRGDRLRPIIHLPSIFNTIYQWSKTAKQPFSEQTHNYSIASEER